MLTASTTVSRCEYCGEPLKRIDTRVYRKTRNVPCFGSCGCDKSAQKLASFGAIWSMPHDTANRCPKCGGTMQADGRTPYVSDCPWCGYSCVFSADLEKHLAEKASEGKRHVLEGTGVPMLYWDVEADYTAASRIMKTGKAPFITGGNGTFKTLTAASIAKAYAELGKRVRFVSSVKLLTEFKDAYGSNRTEGEVFDDLNGSDLLVIDDLGKENPTSWAATMLYAVIDGRYGSMRPVMVTSNYTEGELVARMAESYDASTAKAMMSRLVEMTEKVELDGPDRRLG